MNIDKYKEIQENGVTYYVTKDAGECQDIVVDGNAKEVRFDGGIKSVYVLPRVSRSFQNKGYPRPKITERDMEKSFPSVVTIYIGKDVDKILIPNRMFPNVREVISDSPCFMSGSMLKRKYESGNTVLANSFCLRPEEPLDLKGVTGIESTALIGCASSEILNEENVKLVQKKAFLDSDIPLTHYPEYHVVMAGRILIELDNALNYVIPENTTLLAADLSIDLLKRVDVRCSNKVFFDSIPYIDISACYLTFHQNDHIDVESIIRLHGCYLNIPPDNKEYVKDGDIIYTRDGTVLCGCDTSIEGKVVIPSTVKTIKQWAFFRCTGITEIYIPSSVRKIEREAFAACEGVKKMQIKDGVQELGHGCFDFMNSLKELEIPGSVKDLEFICNGCVSLEHIKVNKGTEKVCLFMSGSGKQVERVDLPSSVSFSSDMSLSGLSGAKRIYLDEEKIPENIILAVYDSRRWPVKKDDYQYTPEEAVKIGEITLIETPVQRIFIPVDTNIKAMDTMNQRVNEQGTQVEADFFQYCSEEKQKLAMAFMEYREKPGQKTKEYLKNHAKELAESFTVNGRDDLLVAFLKFGILDKDVLMEVYDAVKEDAPIAKAYILKVAGKEPGKRIFAL